MKKDWNKPYMMNSISELHRILELPKPQHPLISVINFEEITCYSDEALRSVSYNFYCIALKKGFEGKMKYGQNYYDFDEGVMTFFAPNQIVSTEIVSDLKLSGWWLVVHPDFLINYPLSRKIKEYGYFSYTVNEALHLSEKEEIAVTNIMQILTHEYHVSIDKYSQDVMIAQIELLLTYCNRYYNRQFITRKHASNDLFKKMENILEGYFNADNLQSKGIPTVDFLAKELNVTPHYLSDMLRQLTGLNTQQHIHGKIIEFAKELLSTTDLTVGEIAFRLGFEYSQSFNKLFKNKTNQSPIEYRNSLN
ncbi:helix-turn-helix domain-containing protein [Flavobacterium sp.]|uniref:helix-turn-helix domain-containing protein n=1 Tax=Flavobacterium sp. TaxID=239 RepID=UPI003D110FE5